VDIGIIRQRLRTCTAIFNEPHFTRQLTLRGGDRRVVLRHLGEPDDLVFVFEEPGRFGDTKHVLHFKISNTRTMILPVIFKETKVFILTYILRHRKWHRR